MNNFVIIVLLASMYFTRSQSQNMDNNFKYCNFNMTVTVDALDDLESTFNIRDVENFLKKVSPDQEVSFKLTCNDQSKNGKNYISFKIDGNSNRPDDFLESIDKIRKSATTFYKTKT